MDLQYFGERCFYRTVAPQHVLWRAQAEERSAATVHSPIRPFRSVVPDWYLRGTSPKCAATALEVSAFPRPTAPRSRRSPAAIQASPPGSRTSPTRSRSCSRGARAAPAPSTCTTAMQFNTGLQFDEIVGNGFLRDMEDPSPRRTIGATSCLRRSFRRPIERASSTPCRSTSTARTGLGTIPRCLRPPASSRRPTTARWSRSARSWRPQAWCRWPSPGSRTGRGSSSTRCSSTEGGRDLYLEVLGKKEHRRDQRRRLPRGRRDVRGAPGPGRPRQPRAQVERRHQHGDHRQGGDAGDGRLGQGRVHRRRPDRR